MSLHALGGSPLIGDRLMRFVYLDESGLNRDDKYVVVAGVLIDADRQWRDTEDYLRQLTNLNVPPRQQTDFAFHALRLHQGRAWEPHELYPHPIQRGILQKICEIPGRFNIPVVIGYTNRHEASAVLSKSTAHEVTVICQAIAASVCAAIVELFMRGSAPNEVATLVYEDNSSARRLIKMLHNRFRSRESQEEAELIIGTNLSEVLPFERIVNTAHFAEKLDTSLLQVADACAFATRRHLAGVDSDGLFECFSSMIVKHPDFLGDEYDRLLS